MFRRLLLVIGLCFIIGSASAVAQDNKFEVNGTVGFTLSEGVDVNHPEGDELGIKRLSPKSAFSFSLGADYLLSENFAIGFNYGQEQSTLRADLESLQGLDITDMNVHNYHGIFTYNFGSEDDAMRPFIFGGLGATQYSPDAIDSYNVSGSTRFSTTWGGGVKFFTSDHLGFKAGVRWTPTYINSEASGLWCSPYWPWSCWVATKANYSHQFEINGGIVARF
jgi:opacity protein-like surface antigen